VSVLLKIKLNYLCIKSNKIHTIVGLRAEAYGVGYPRQGDRRLPQAALEVATGGGRRQGIQGKGMAGSIHTLGSPWQPLAIRP
jgi:hypothetical protein